MTQEAWGRWGNDDERGALNLIGPDQTRAAAALVRSGRVISLAQSLSPSTPVPGHRAPLQHFMGRDGGDYAAGGKRPGGFQFAEDTLVLPLHVGTHIDALCHAWHDDQLYNGFPSTGIRSTTGAARCAVDKLGPVAGRGVLLDLCTLHGSSLPMGMAVTPELLEAAQRRAGVSVQPGDVVLLRTGWLESMLDDARYYDGEPGLDVAGALWLVERGVALVGADNYAVEAIPFPAGQVFPVHQCLLRNHGVSLIEGLALAELAQAGAGAFLFIATPLPIAGGTASPLAPVAIL